jgi:hypothetical protein
MVWKNQRFVLLRKRPSPDGSVAQPGRVWSAVKSNKPFSQTLPYTDEDEEEGKDVRVIFSLPLNQK